MMHAPLDRLTARRRSGGRRVRRRLVVSLVGCLLAVGLHPAVAEPGVGAASNVEHVQTLALEVGSVQAMAVRGTRLVVQGRAGLAIYDVADPAAPRLAGRLPFTYRSFGEELQVSSDGSRALLRESGFVGGTDDVLHVFDLRDPAAMREVAALRVRDGSFTCVLDCTWAYGSQGSVVDLRHPDRPRFAGGPGTWNRGYGDASDVSEVRPGMVVTTPSKGIFDDRILAFRALDVTDPLNPRLVATGESPNERYSFRAARWHDGDDRLLLMQAVFNGETLFCTSQGPLLAYETSGLATTGRLRLVGRYEVGVGRYVDGSPAATATLACDGYGLREHPSFDDGGLVVQAHAEHGTRFVAVDGAGRFREVGYFLPYGTFTTGVEWASNRDDERIAYAADAARGISVLRFTGKLRG
jgi:hypothetical protein